MLRLKEIYASYGEIAALKGVSIEVMPGEIVALLGSNGAGKSTVLRAISGLVKPRSGEIVYGGRPLAGRKPFEIARSGIVHCPEGRRLFANLTVLENLEMGAYSRGDSSGIASDLDRAYGLFPVLAERRRQRAGTLSGGEQQMLALARALMARPQLVLLDEPSLGLSPILIEEIFSTIAQIRREGVTILLVEQNAHVALEVADRGYVLETGRVTVSGPAKALKSDRAIVEAYLGG